MTSTATAQKLGKLAHTPLVVTLASLLAQRGTGSLVFREPSGQRSALVSHLGVIGKAHTPALILDGPDPAEQVCQQVEWASELIGSTAFGYFADVDFLPKVQRTPTGPLALIWRCARRSVHPAIVERYLSRLGHRSVSLHLQARLDLFGLNWDELAALDPLRTRPREVEELLPKQPAERLQTQRLLYTLALAGHLDVGDGRGPIGVEAGGSSVPAAASMPGAFSQVPSPRASPPPVAPKRTVSGLVHRSVTSEPARPLPPVPRPPRFRTVGLRVASLPPPPKSVAPRSIAPRSIAPRSIAPESSRESAEARLIRAEVLARRGEYERALQIAEHASAGWENDTSRRAFVAYLRVRCGKVDPDQADKYLDVCRLAAQEHPDSADVRYYSAWILKAAGRELEAMRLFSRIVRDDPSHIDAARELHLFRRRREREANGGAGLIGLVRRSLSPAPGVAPHGTSRPPKR